MEPFFNSEWSMMRAYDDLRSKIDIEHGIGDWPAIVDVQIKPTSQAQSGNGIFMIKGAEFAQQSDGQNSVYGGIVYIYDKTKVKLFAPNNKDGSGTGTIISAGERSDHEENIQNEDEVFVRTRVWRYLDVPKPDFEPDWMFISSANSSYIEFDHKLNKEPEYVSIQIKLDITDVKGSDASSQEKIHTIISGGVNYAYDNKNIRIWIPKFQSTGKREWISISSFWVISIQQFLSNYRKGLIYSYSDLFYKIWFENGKGDKASIHHKATKRNSRFRNSTHDIILVDIVIILWKPNEMCYSTTTIQNNEKIKSTRLNYNHFLTKNEEENTTFINATEVTTAKTT